MGTTTKIIAGVIAAGTLAGAIAGGIDLTQGAQTPTNLQLKADPGAIVYSEDFTDPTSGDADTSYIYETPTIAAPMPNEVVSLRNVRSYTIQDDATHYSAVSSMAPMWWQDASDGQWHDIAQATTTQAVFHAQVSSTQVLSMKRNSPILFGLIGVAYAQTAGPTVAGTGGNNATIGTVAWTSTTGVSDTQSNCATAGANFVTSTSGTISEYLTATNYSFSIPVGATLNGITIKANGAGTAASTVFIEDSIKILKGGTISGTDQSTGAQWVLGCSVHTWGGTSNLWGVSWTPSDINASTFGVAIASKKNVGSTSQTNSINDVTATITYTAATAKFAPWQFNDF